MVNVGLDESAESEGLDRTSLAIPPCQVNLLEELAKTASQLLLSSQAGRAVELPWEDKVSAILHDIWAGRLAQAAVWEVLTGEIQSVRPPAEAIP